VFAEFLSDIFGGASPVRRFMNSTLENPAFSLQDPQAFSDVNGSAMSDAGIAVSPYSALSLAPFWQAVSMISGDVAALPLDVYQRLDEDDREVDLEHPAEFLVSSEANDETPAFEFWRRIVAHAIPYQNGYAYIDRNSRFGPPLGLYNLLPDRTCPMRREDGTLYYVTEVDGVLEPLFKEEVLHIKGLSLDPSRGYDLVRAARNSIGLALAAEGYSSKFFANGAQAAGILTIPAGFKEMAAKNLEEGFKKRTEKNNWFKTLILRDGAKFDSVTVDAQKAQLHELREDQVRDIARFCNMPMFKLGLQDSQGYNSAEMSHTVYMMSCLLHWMCAIVGESQMKLLTMDERRSHSHYMEHNVVKGLEIDVKTMNEVLQIQRQNEIINANEWRRKINLNKRADPGGDEYINPNTKSAPTGGGEPSKPEDKALDKKPKQAAAIKLVLADSINRVARRVCFDARKASAKPAKFAEWIDSGAAEHRKVFAEAISAAVALWCVAIDGRDDELAFDLRMFRLDTAFFSLLLDGLRPLLEPPNTAGNLAANCDEACNTFESRAAEVLLSLLGADDDEALPV